MLIPLVTWRTLIRWRWWAIFMSRRYNTRRGGTTWWFTTLCTFTLLPFTFLLFNNTATLNRLNVDTAFFYRLVTGRPGNRFFLLRFLLPHRFYAPGSFTGGCRSLSVTTTTTTNFYTLFTGFFNCFNSFNFDWWFDLLISAVTAGSAAVDGGGFVGFWVFLFVFVFDFSRFFLSWFGILGP